VVEFVHEGEVGGADGDRIDGMHDCLLGCDDFRSFSSGDSVWKTSTEQAIKRGKRGKEGRRKWRKT
jgi:hypothetical protein